MTTIEHTALTNLIHNETFARKVLPFLKGDYFSDRTDRIVFEEIQKFVEKYNALPNHTSIEVEMSSRKDLNEEDYRIRRYIMQLLQGLKLLRGRIMNVGWILFLAFLQMPLLLVSITVLVTIIWLMQIVDLSFITR